MRGLVAFGYMAIGLASHAHASPRSLPGWPLYDRLCAACHGEAGDGRGPAAAFANGRPRDFTRGAFEWRSTVFGAAPTDDDLRQTIRLGARGTSMPGFADVLTPAELAELVAIVKAFDPPAFAAHATPIRLGAPTPLDDAASGAKLWIQLGCDKCHGATGRGDGPAAKSLPEPPYDLTAELLRRPRDGDAPGDRRRAAAWSIATGMTGTPMPAYAEYPAAEIWALADHVVALGAHATRDPIRLDADAIAGDRSALGTWPGTDPDDATIFGAALAPQGVPPPSLAPAEASLSAAQCGRCHAKQTREWERSIHARAMSIGFAARTTDGANAESCRRCHAPLAEQADPQLATEGVSCAGCHVRAWTRRGPPGVAPSLIALPGYPFAPSTLYERADFCLPCHQLPPRTAIAGKPLLDTYKEWLEGPYMRRGIQCQSCHMPNREHEWLGVHDPATFRQGIRLSATARIDRGAITVTAELANVGAGHDLPTTPTPVVWLRLELLDGARVVGRWAQRIGRDVYWDGAWHERADTRIPPGESLRVARVWRGGHATAARITVEVAPDDYYEHLYAARLADQLAPAVRARYQAALDRASGSHYIADTRIIQLQPSVE